MEKHTSDDNVSLTSTTSPQLSLKTQGVNLHNKLQARHSIDVGSFARSSSSKTKPTTTLDPTKPCQLDQVITDALTSFNVNKNPKVKLHSSDSWITTRDSYDCDFSYNTSQSDPNLKSVSLESLSMENNDDEEVNKHHKADVAGTISDKTKTLLNRSKTLNGMIDYKRPKRKKSNIFRDLVLPKVETRSSSFNSINDVSNRENVNILRRPYSASCLCSNQDKREFIKTLDDLKDSPNIQHISSSAAPHKEKRASDIMQRPSTAAGYSEHPKSIHEKKHLTTVSDICAKIKGKRYTVTKSS